MRRSAGWSCLRERSCSTAGHAKQSGPDWTLLPFDGLDQWPAIEWKLHNIQQVSTCSHKNALSALKNILQI